jgi:hypothetical protein
MLTSLIHKDIFGREGMIYCLISIGVIGYFVWALFVMGLFFIKIFYFHIEVINFAICWNSLKLLSTYHSKNLNNYTQSAGNLIDRSTSETTREISFNLNLFYKSCSRPQGYGRDKAIGYSKGIAGSAGQAEIIIY